MDRLSWPEIRTNAAEFSREWKDAHYERGETQSFYNDFFQVFGVKRRQVASFERSVTKLDNKRGFIDLFWPGILLVEQKSAGRSLEKAEDQAFEYFTGLKPYEIPRYILLCDFQNFELLDLDQDTIVKFLLADLYKHVEAFGFILGIQKRTFRDQDPVNIAASELMGQLHDSLKASGYVGQDLERLLVRLLFCLFADDTGIFEPRGIFTSLIADRTQENGSDLGIWLTQLFDVLNEPEASRQAYLDEDLRAFPYINGALFADRLRVPNFSSKMRQQLLEACEFNWDAISPAIFGSLFQSVMNPAQRREEGAHYTTERNILKVIEPLFLDELRAEFVRLDARRDTQRRTVLEQFHERLAQIHFFDPACGCGNFLIIAYRELRELELDVLLALGYGKQRVTDIQHLIKLNVDQFYGIEINEFPARIAEVALWMTDHIANVRASLELGQVFARIPLTTSPHIHHADALEKNWMEVLPPEECNYVFGNPPFSGAKKMPERMRQQIQRIQRTAGLQGEGTLDYVCAWFLKAGEYIQTNTDIKIAFVSTNSVTQGEQVAQLWPLLFDRYSLEIDFAHRTFKWGSDARGVAQVHIVIVGLVHRSKETERKRLFTYKDINGDPTEVINTKLSPYLTDASRLQNPHLVVSDISRPLVASPLLGIGSKPVDGGNFIIDTDEERDAFLQAEPEAKPYLRPYIGADEFVNGEHRWILALQQISPATLRRLPAVLDRVRRVEEFRTGRTSADTKKLAKTPTLYHVNVIPEGPFLVIPRHTSEHREYVPIGYMNPPYIPSDATIVMLNPDVWHFGILTSKMHMAWLWGIGGRIKSDVRYSKGVVYNNFPWPAVDEAAEKRIREFAQRVLDVRAQYPEATLADLYDRQAMPPTLRKAHYALDTAVDRLYRSAPFNDDVERVEFLLAIYEQLKAPLIPAEPTKPNRRKAKAGGS